MLDLTQHCILIPSSSPQAMEEAAFMDGFNSGVVDEFSVDELLNFSNQEELCENEEDEEVGDTAPLICREIRGNGTTASFYDSLPFNELHVPVDELANLEWLSDFVDDANAEYATPFPLENKPESEGKKTVIKPESVTSGLIFELPIPSKARSKRRRRGARVWQSPESSVSSSSSASYVSSCNQTTCCLRKKRKGRHQNGGALQVGGRRCTHCGVQKTPQWRAGPMGTKTLCNACGVRFKSGRLLPEYRPACSPTFSSVLHSNSHRKVLEMRKRKYSLLGSEPGC